MVVFKRVLCTPFGWFGDEDADAHEDREATTHVTLFILNAYHFDSQTGSYHLPTLINPLIVTRVCLTTMGGDFNLYLAA